MKLNRTILVINLLVITLYFSGQLYSQSLDSTTIISSDTEDDIQELGFVYENMPEFPGGLDSLRIYLQSKISITQDSIIDGKVYVQFWIDKSGNVIDSKIIRGINSYQDNEALRVVNSMPKWKPGENNGEKRKVPFTIPIIFKKTEE